MTELDLECIKVATSAVCDLDFLFAFVLGDEPFKRSVADALHGMRGRGGREGRGGRGAFGGESESVGVEFYLNGLGDRIVDDERHVVARLS